MALTTIDEPLPRMERATNVTPLANPQSLFREPYLRVLEQIRQLGDLREGWDSYGAHEIPEEARTNAIRFLSMLVAGIDERIPPPVVGPSPDGGVVLRWEIGDREVMVKLLSEGGEYYVARKGSEEFDEDGDVGRLEALANRLRMFFARQ